MYRFLFLLIPFVSFAQPRPPVITGGGGNSSSGTNGLTALQVAAQIVTNGTSVATAMTNADNTFTGAFDGSGSLLTGLNASNLEYGTIPDARFPAILPAADGSLLTSLSATNITGTFTEINVITLNATNMRSVTLGNTNANAVWGPDGNLTNGPSGSAYYGPFTNQIIYSDGAASTAFTVRPQIGSSSNVVARINGTNGTSGLYLNDQGGMTNNGTFGASGAVYFASTLNALSLTINGGVATILSSGVGNFASVATGIRTVAKTSNSTLNSTTDLFTSFNNSGASGAVTNTLPATAVGRNYKFTIVAAQVFCVQAAGSDVIRYGGTVGGAAGRIYASTPGMCLELICDVAGTWTVHSAQAIYTAGAISTDWVCE